ncbi:MAG TPA: DUF2231 domain-containing protein [bacterium]|nr:DUF2231 domain-containing protein [bacterium]
MDHAEHLEHAVHAGHSEDLWHEIGELGHLVAIHFPIGIYFLELLIIFFWFYKKEEMYRLFALFSFRAGYLIMLGALVTGWMAAGGWENISGAVARHFWAAAAVFTLYTGRAVYWRLSKETEKINKLLFGGIACLGYVLVLLTAFFGGKLGHG